MNHWFDKLHTGTYSSHDAHPSPSPYVSPASVRLDLDAAALNGQQHLAVPTPVSWDRQRDLALTIDSLVEVDRAARRQGCEQAHQPHHGDDESEADPDRQGDREPLGNIPADQHEPAPTETGPERERSPDREKPQNRRVIVIGACGRVGV